MRLAAALQSAPIYAIYDTRLRPDLAASEVIARWLHAGIRVIQYRHKGQFDGHTLRECEKLAGLVSRQDGLFIVNDRADVAVLVGAQGVHLGQEDLRPEEARNLLPAPLVIGHSTHNLVQLTAAVAMPIDYLAVGPVFSTSTKKNPDPVVGLGLVKAARRMSAVPVVAIGGISLENLGSVLREGAGAVAMVSGLVVSCRSGNEVEARAREALSRAIAEPLQAPAEP